MLANPAAVLQWGRTLVKAAGLGKGLYEGGKSLLGYGTAQNQLIPYYNPSVPRANEINVQTGKYSKKQTLSTKIDASTSNFYDNRTYNKSSSDSMPYRRRYRSSFGGKRRYYAGRKKYRRRYKLWRRGYARQGGQFFIKRAGIKKWADTSVGASSGDMLEGAWTDYQVVPNIARGTAQNERIGSKLLITKIQGSGILELPRISTAPTSTNSMSNCMVKFALVLDKQANGQSAFPVNSWLTADLYNAHHNMDNPWRFRTLHEFTLPLEPKTVLVTNAGTTPQQAESNLVTVPFEFNLKTAIKLTYDTTNTTGAYTAMRQNQIWLMASQIGRENTTGRPIWTCDCRIRFVDLQ